MKSRRAVVECTSNGYWLSDLLRSLGVCVVLAHAKYLKAIAYAKVKTDAVDAHTLAQLLRMDFIPQAHQMSGEYRALRDLLRQRMVMEHQRTNLMVRINSMLAKFNITELPCVVSQARFADFLATCTIDGRVSDDASSLSPAVPPGGSTQEAPGAVLQRGTSSNSYITAARVNPWHRRYHGCDYCHGDGRNHTLCR